MGVQALEVSGQESDSVGAGFKPALLVSRGGAEKNDPLSRLRERGRGEGALKPSPSRGGSFMFFAASRLRVRNKPPPPLAAPLWKGGLKPAASREANVGVRCAHRQPTRYSLDCFVAFAPRNDAGFFFAFFAVNFFWILRLRFATRRMTEF
jgi:hypothetical protein